MNLVRTRNFWIALVVIALAVAILAPLLLGWPWLAAIYKALVLLVIACPCALVISTPVKSRSSSDKPDV